MKKLLVVLLCLALAVTPVLTSCKKKAAEEDTGRKKKVKEEKVLYEVEDIPYEFKTSGKTLTAEIQKYIGEDETDIVIPETITDAETGEKCTVTEISDGAFMNNETVESVEVPEGVTKIGDGAFQNCVNLKAAKLPSTLEEIGVRAFYNCTQLTDFDIPAKVSNIGFMAFSDYFVSSPWYDKVTAQTTAIVGDGILLKYNGTAEAVFGDEVKHIAYFAFLDSPVTDATFTSALETIDEKAFLGTTIKLHLPSGSAAATDASAAGATVVTE